MASLNRGQPPARHTKVVHQGPRCLKAGSKGEVESNCSHDVVSSKPVTGRDMTDVVQSEVTSCGNKRCQNLRSRLNNHRNRVKQLCNLYFYQFRWPRVR